MSSAIVPLMDIGSDMSNALNIGADDGRKIANGMVMGMREKIIELLGEDVCIHDCCGDCECQGNEDMCIALLKAYMADHLIENNVVLVVRCKNCKHRIYSEFDGCHVCHHGGFNAINEEHFCSYGERRT